MPVITAPKYDAHLPICDAPPAFEIGAAQLRSVTEIAPKSPFLCETEALASMVFEAAQKPSSIV